MKLKTAADAPPLSKGVVLMALSGWGALPRDLSPDDDAGTFELFQGNLPAMAALWREHASFLRSEAARLKIEPSESLDGRAMFFAEYAVELIRREPNLWRAR